jgi:hypothetical protein
MVERYNRTIENMLASFVAKHQWLTGYLHMTTGVSPCKMMFGRVVLAIININIKI